MRTYLLPYNAFSKSANNLKAYANDLDNDNPFFKIQFGSLLRAPHNNVNRASPSIYVNWGCRDTVVLNIRLSNKANVLKLNFTRSMALYQNKREFFNCFGSSCLGDRGEIIGLDRDLGRTVPFTTSHNMARYWINSGHTIFERKKLSSHSGDGIVIHRPEDTPTPFNAASSLFTLYIKKAAEYRVHFSKAQGIFHIQQKMLRIHDTPPMENNNMRYMVRNLASGWVYSAHTDINDVPPDVIRQANLFINSDSNSLDFGALDIIYNKRNSAAYILEVNTSPGLSGTTLDRYYGMLRYYAANHNFASADSRYSRQ